MEIVISVIVFLIIGIFAAYLIFPIIFGILMVIESVFGDVIERWTSKSKSKR